MEILILKIIEKGKIMKRKELVVTVTMLIVLLGVAYGISLYQNRQEPINDKLWVIVEKIHKTELKIETTKDIEAKKGQAKMLLREILRLKITLREIYTNDNLVFIAEDKLEKELSKYLEDKNVSTEMMQIIKAKE